ncbi:DUF3343 domain-containing protein [Parendozoicomonas sp. Alg238-R29]|uniref:DUF3343 domain-containing protein n=1 Tax=Parendozoicomonas sp. Alg238-R29 TaxID=2993446 RepID=UPI00248F3091|nr:DUF3343 domain-containing protein [Parendozoicomonas sp. Alg238-R29]
MSRTFLLFKTMRYAIKAEAHCREQNISCQVLPVPREISSECGMCLEVNPAKADTVKDQLDTSGFQVTLARI